MKTLADLTEKLKGLVGQTVRCSAGEDCMDGPGLYFNFYGTLEAPEEGCDRWYIRVRDGYNGAEGIGFHVDQVQDIHKQVYNYEISFKQKLSAPGY